MPAATESARIGAAMRRYMMVVLTVVYTFNFVDRQIMAILLPAIRDEFAVGDTVLGLLTGTAFAMFYVSLGVPIGRLADRFNRRSVIALSLAVWSGMTALCGLAVNIWQLALARIGVGIGEAGGNPPAHSIIADLYPPGQRGTAMGFYSLGVSAGIMIAFLVGGWLVQNFGWREAFLIFGLPGLALSLLVRFSLPEPARGRSERRRDSGRPPAFAAVLRFLLARRSAVFLALGAGLASFSGYSIAAFMPSFAARSFSVPIAELGLWLGLTYGVAGGIGFFGGGLVADRLGRTGHRRALLFIAAALLLTSVLHVAVFLSASLAWCLVLFVVPVATSSCYLAPVLAEVQSLVSLRMRSLASAILLLTVNVIGLAIGPPVTGAISDWLQPSAGPESMRYSLLIVSSVMLPLAAWCFVRAGRTIDADLARSDELD